MPVVIIALEEESDVLPRSNFMKMAHTGFNSYMEVKRS